MSERQKICKCGDAVGNLLTRTYDLEGFLTTIKFDPRQIPAHKESTNYIYGGINRVDQSCGVDTRLIQDYAMEMFGKLDVMETTKDRTKFYEKRNSILNDLSGIRRDTLQKIKDCTQ